MLARKPLLSNQKRKILKRFYSKTVKNSNWKSVIGLEVHAQIASKSKLFSGASTKFSSPVNTSVSLFDMATPGTLPVLNKKCVEAGVLTALALNCKVHPISYFDRKHYFYADLPSGYQITQQRAPLATDGRLDFPVFTTGIHKIPYRTGVRIKQLQLEQDSGRSLHESDRSLVDLNRAGVPLMEVVFEPDLQDGEEAAALVKELMLILERIGTCSCKMEEGAVRIDANVSIHQENEPFGVRTEVKNIGSIRGVAGAVKYEIERQIKVKDSGGTIVNETRSWNAEKKITVPMRDKEEKQDYRYMPEPNLPPLHLAMGPVNNNQINVNELSKIIPELPESTRVRLRNQFNLTELQAMILVNDPPLLNIFEEAIQLRKINPVFFGHFLINDVNAVLNELKMDLLNINCKPDVFGEIFELFQNEMITKQTSKLVLTQVLTNREKNPLEIIKKNNWNRLTDKELKEVCLEIIKQNPTALNQYLGGKAKVFKFFVNQVKKQTESRAGSTKATEVLTEIFREMMKKK